MLNLPDATGLLLRNGRLIVSEGTLMPSDSMHFAVAICPNYAMYEWHPSERQSKTEKKLWRQPQDGVCCLQLADETGLM